MIRLRRPSLRAVALTLAGMLLFSALGVWQLRRAAEKDALLARFDASSRLAVEDYPGALPRSEGALPHVRVRGEFLQERIYVLDDQSRHGRQGVVVFAPFAPCADSACATHSERLVLVGLGFLARDPAARALPQLPPLKHGVHELEGALAPPPASGLRLGGDALPRQHAWPKLTTFIDLDAISRDLGRALDARVLLLDADPASAYLRAWTPEVMPPVRHRAYALQWFTFALAALVIFLILHRDKDKEKPDDAA